MQKYCDVFIFSLTRGISDLLWVALEREKMVFFSSASEMMSKVEQKTRRRRLFLTNDPTPRSESEEKKAKKHPEPKGIADRENKQRCDKDVFACLPF